MKNIKNILSIISVLILISGCETNTTTNAIGLNNQYKPINEILIDVNSIQSESIKLKDSKFYIMNLDADWPKNSDADKIFLTDVLRYMNENSIKYSDQASTENKHEIAVNRIAGQSNDGKVYIIKYQFVISKPGTSKKLFESTAQIVFVGPISSANEIEQQYKSILIKVVFNSIEKSNYKFHQFVVSPDDLTAKLLK